jgi:hypothetical protein
VTTATVFSQTTNTPVLALPAVNCSIMPAPPLPAGTTWFPFTVTLRVRDSQGNASAVVVDNGARLFPNGTCGF